MKITTIILILILVANFSYSQTEKYSKIFKAFKENYNTGNFENIFNDFSATMQKALPAEKTKQFFSGLKSQAGNMKEESFLKMEHESYAVYKATFEKAILTVNISIDENSKINGLYINPFTEEKKTNVTNGLSAFPKEIATIIYSYSKDFPNKTQLSIAVIEEGKVSYYGVKIENDTLQPTKNQNHIFEIGSITKVFTSSVLASLVVDNKLKLNDLVNDYYAVPFNNNIKIKFLDLSNHTSGLPRLPENLDLSNEVNPYKNYGEKELNEYLTKFLKVENSSNKTYDYSNLGAGILGHTLGLSQKQTFSELLQERIFKKYEMNSSYTSLSGTENMIIKGLDEHGQEVSNWEFDVLFGGGGILSTSEDLVRFAQAQFDTKNKELELTRTPTFNIDDNMKIGLGWHILKSENNFNMFWHNGGTGGYTSSMVLDIEKRNGVIVLSNISAFNPKMGNIDKLSFKLIKQIKD